MTTGEIYKTVRSFTLTNERIAPIWTDLTVEVPLEIVINGKSHVLIMFTPGMTRELVVGFLFTEGLINRAKEIESLVISAHQKKDGDMIIEADVRIPQHFLPVTTSSGKRVSYSSCGICGTENYHEMKQRVHRVKSRHRFSMHVLLALSRDLKRFQPLYKRTGGSHAAFLFDKDGNDIQNAEDMGRHNAVDKVIGAVMRQGIRTHDKMLFSSGRASLEMILKTARAGFPLFVAMSRPTSRAVEAAKYYNITLVDLAKNTNRVHSHVRRINGF